MTRLILVLCLFAPVLAGGCYERPVCSFRCGEDGACPYEYRCAPDGRCKLRDVSPSYECPADRERPDAAPPGLDAGDEQDAASAGEGD